MAGGAALTTLATDRYEALMDVVRNRMTNRAFAPCDVPREHFELILEAARHAPTPNDHGVKTAPGLIVIAADFRFIRAFPVLSDGCDLDPLYRQNAERILLQSVAASTMSAHLAAAALGYAVWWITAIGQDDIQRKIRPMLGVSDALAIIDVMCFGPPAKPSYKCWRKTLPRLRG